MRSGATIVLLRAVLAASLLGLATPDALAACDPSQQCCASSDSPAGSTTCGGDGVASQGNGSLVDLGAGNPINLLNGNKFQREVDLAPLPGVLGLELVRYYNSAETRTGWLGRGWRLSYESELHLRPGGLEIVQPDGRRIAFTQSPQQLDSYHPGSPTQGGVRAERKQEGTEYTWTWADGRELRFNTRGKLASIRLPTGESVSLRYDDKGRLTEVVDPAGRRLSLYYLDQVDQASARRGERFRGVQHIDTPVGRFAYEYGSALPEGSSAPPRRLLANLVKVHSPTGEEPTQRKPTLHGLAPYEPQRPAAAESGTAATTAATTAADSTATTRTTTSAPGISRSYHYEDPRFPTLLTGISVEGKGSDGQRSQQRLSTWAYDAQRRAILSVRGERPAQGSGSEGNGTRDNGARGSGTSGSGLEQVTLQWLPPKQGRAQTLLTNSLGQQTTYTHTTLAGQARLVQVRGAGCASCGPGNMRYGYDRLGRLTEETTLDAAGRPIQTRRTELDRHGRPVLVSTIAWREGRPQAPQWQRRYEYASFDEGTPLPGPQPVLIARPSVIAGQEHRLHLTYNNRGQPTEVTETGFSPVDDEDHPAPEGHAIRRTTRYTYAEINGRSLLASVDGPLANGPLADPSDSDITRYEWDREGNQPSRITRPAGLTSTFEVEPSTGRLLKTTDPAGLATSYRYGIAHLSRPSEVERAGRLTRYAFDVQGRVSRIHDATGRGITLAYDAAGHLLSVTDAQGYKAQVTLDTEGLPRVAGLYEPNQAQPLRATYRWFDEQRRLVRQLRPDGRLDSWRHDAPAEQHLDGDEVLHLTRRNAVGWQAELQLAPDGLIRASLAAPVRAASEPGDGRTLRDDFGRSVLVWRPEQGVSITRHDVADRAVRVQLLGSDAQPAGRIDTTYDPAGRLLQRITRDAQGRATQTLQRRYDSARLVEETDNTQARRFRYDAQGRVNETEVMLKDEQGQAAYTTTLATSYDPNTGEPLTHTLADARVMRIERDAATGVARRIALQGSSWAKLREHLPAFMREWLPQTSLIQDLGFHPYNGITGYTQGNGIATARSFDIAGRLTELKVGRLTEQALSYEVGPRIRRIEDRAAALQAPWQASYDYAGFGALKQEARQLPEALKQDAALQGDAVPVAQVTGLPLASVERDARGRTTADGRHRYTYTPAGQIETVRDPQGRLIARYRYNAAGQRVSKTVHVPQGHSVRDQMPHGARTDSSSSIHTTYFLWHDGRLVAEVEGSGEHQGEVSAQYLYLTQGGQPIPVAKLESAHASGNPTGEARVLYIHAGHRGEPLAMTDEQQRLVWHARSDAFGHIAMSQLQGTQAELNLRLPGQYFDAETGLHDNWHRSYDPRPDSPQRGRYLQPDPLGYPDGPDTYLYVGGDPINRIDPLGLYQIDMHYYMTYFLAAMAGLPQQAALTMALAAQYVDDNPHTWPVDPNNKLDNVADFGAMRRLSYYHFTQDGYDPPRTAAELVVNGLTGQDLDSYINRRVMSPTNPQLSRLLGVANFNLRTAQNPNGERPCTRVQLFGEYLHALEDTFGHRNASNEPIGVKLGLGHGLDGHEPDRTFDSFFWPVRERRTLETEREVFRQIKANFGTEARDREGFPIRFEDLEATLRKFNGEREDEDVNKGAFTKKKEVLNNALQRYGFAPIPDYDVFTACQRRQENLRDALRTMGDFTGVILQTPRQCPTVRGQKTE